jgi:hypothetical protein
MIYFYLWVLFLLSIVLSVPIVAFVEKSKAKKAMGAREEVATSAAAVGDVMLDDAEGAAAGVEDNLDEFAQVNPSDPDDFSAFDDFK